MDGDERIFAGLLVDRGLIPGQAVEDAERALRERGGDVGLVDLLAERAGLSPERRDALLRVAMFTEIRSAIAEASCAPPGLPVPAQGLHFSPPGYEVLEEIGRGGMGVVYRARQVGLDRIVALKVMVAEEASALRALERFHRESKVVARLQHPGIVELFEIGCSGPVHYFAMRYVKGPSLARRLRENRPTPREAMGLAHKLAIALEHAHARGVVHRDVKPSNILIDENGEPLLVDFGLAKDMSATGLTAPGAFLGTPSYASPEQVSGEEAGPRSDVYSLGATLYEMLSGRPPFAGPSVLSTLMAAAEGDLSPPRRWEPSLPLEAEAICLKAMDRDPARRYATASEMALDIDRFLRGAPVHAQPMSLRGRWITRARRHRVALTAALVALLTVGTFAVYVWQRQRGVWNTLMQANQLYLEGQECGERGARRAAFERARDLLGSAMAMDPENEHARLALQRIQAVLDGLDRELAAERQASARQAAEAEELLRKSALVTESFGRWGKLREALRELERVAHDETLSSEEAGAKTRERWPEVEAFMSKTPPDATSRATMLALAGWAARQAGRDEEGLAMMRESASLDEDIPYGALMEAFACFSEWVEQQGLRGVVYGPEGPHFDPPPPEPELLAELRERMKRLLAQAKRARLWGREGAEDLAALVRAIEAEQAGDSASAEEGLTRALEAADLRFIEAGLLLARARARYYLTKYEDALSDLAEVARARPHQGFVFILLEFVDAGRMAAANRQGDDPRPFIERALALTEEALATGPDAGIRRARATLWLERAQWELGRELDPIDSLDRAVLECEEGLRLEPEGLLLHSDRASCSDLRGDVEASRGTDPTRRYEAALEDLDWHLERFPEDPGTCHDRSLTLFKLAEWEMAHGIDSRHRFERAMDDCRRVLELSPGASHAYWQLARILTTLGSYEEAVDMYERSLAAGDPRPEVGTWWIDQAKDLAATPIDGDDSRWLAAATQGSIAIRGGDYARARSFYEALQAIARSHPDALPPNVVIEAHVSLARILSLLSDGRERPDAATRAVAPDEAARLRDDAFRHLGLAIGAGWRDLDDLGDDAAPLRSDSRWSGVVEACGRSR